MKENERIEENSVMENHEEIKPGAKRILSEDHHKNEDL